MTRTLRCFALAVASLPATGLAHHGWSSYDLDNTVRIQGTFSSVSWQNPHGTATMRWQDRDWDVILAPISRMEARGLSREMVEPGQQIGIVGYPRKDGTAEIRLERLIVGDKTVELR
jgi:hypothetical protein